MQKFRLQFLVLLLFGIGSVVSVAAQTSKGFVVGTVEDPNGASIPNAAIKITNTKTGVVRDTVADSSGSFRLDAVDPGIYTLEASGQGFKTVKLDKVEV